MVQRLWPPSPSTGNGQVLLLGFLLALSIFAASLNHSSRVYLFEQAQCRAYYRNHDPSVIGPAPDYRLDESRCKGDIVQANLSLVLGIDTCLASLPALLVLAAYEKLLSLQGLRHLIVLNLVCSALGVLFFTAVLRLHQPWDVYVAPLSFIFDLVGGGDLVRRMLLYTCIASVAPAENLTKIYNYMSATFLATSIIGAMLGASLLSRHVWLLNSLSILTFASTACVASLIPRHFPLNNTGDSDATSSLISPDAAVKRLLADCEDLNKAGYKSAWISALLSSWRSFPHLLSNLFSMSPIPRACIALLFLDGLVARLGVLFPQYTSIVLSWPLASVNRLFALEGLVSWLVLLALPILRSWLLEPYMSVAHVDLTVVQASLIANIVGTIGLGFSLSKPLFIAGLTIYVTGVGVDDSLRSFGTQGLGKSEKLSDFYVRISLVETIPGLIGTPLWSLMFTAVLKTKWAPMGLSLWFAAGLYGLGLVGVTTLKRWHGNGHQYGFVPADLS